MSVFAEKTLLVTFSSRSWGGQKRDRKAAEDACEASGAEAKSVKADKWLVPELYLKPVAQAIGRARATHKYLTLPWSDGGATGLVAAHALDAYAEELRHKEAEVIAAVDTFCTQYPTLKLHASRRLGALFHEEDYPDERYIRNRFGIAWSFSPVPVAGDLRVELSDEWEAEVKASIERDTETRFDTAVGEVRDRITDTVSKLLHRLKTYEVDENGKSAQRFHPSLIDNVARLADVLPLLNFKGDPALDRVAADLRKLGTLDADILKSSENSRKKAAQEAEKVLSGAGEFFSLAA